MPVLKCTKREKFAQGVATGKTQADAYRLANPGCVERGWKDETIWSKASTWMADGKVAERVAELRAQVAEKALWTREDSVRALIPIVDWAERENDRIAAVKVLNDMHGFNAPIKTEITGKDGAPIQLQAVDTSGLSVAEKRALLQLIEKIDGANNGKLL